MITGKQKRTYYTATNDNIKQIVNDEIQRWGNDIDLSNIDVSEVTDMHDLFLGSDFNGNISEWNVSKVINMDFMFAYSKFDKDISNWNVKNVRYNANCFLRSPLQYQPNKRPKF